MEPLAFSMILGEMLVPIEAFNALPISAITSGEICIILTAHEAKPTIGADVLAFGTMLTAVLAEICTFRTGTALGAYLNAFTAEIAVYAHCINTAAAGLVAILTERLILSASLAVRAMI